MKAVVFTLGCKVNRCESNSLLYGLRELNYEVSEELEKADLYILNTCAVTAEAEKKSRQAVTRIRKLNADAQIIITGCASEKMPSAFYGKQNVTLVTGAKSKEKILDMLTEKGVKIEKGDFYGDEKLPAITSKARAFIKVQDGCNNFCSYCIIPYLRGRNRSRSAESVKKEIEYLQPKEAVITGINLSAYAYEGKKLKDLMFELKSFECRLRLGSLEVNVIDVELMNALKELKNFAPHFHLSLQSGSNSVLKDMNRHYMREKFLEKVALIRDYFPNAAITTDVIVGYPTETEQDFKDTLDLIDKVEFADVHCFSYSAREGTVAAKLKGLPEQVKRERLSKLLEIKAELIKTYSEKNLGKTFTLIAEEYKNGLTTGYTENYIKTYVEAELKEGDAVKVRVEKLYNDGVFAVIQD